MFVTPSFVKSKPRFKSLSDVVFIMLIDVNIYEHDKFCAQLS